VTEHKPAAQQSVESAKRSDDGERLLAVFTKLVEPIGRSLPTSSEVVLHDLSLLPNSIVAIYGNVTGRRVGDPATDLLLQKVSALSEDNMVGYESVLPDGRKIRSSTMIIRDDAGTPIAAFCINSDLSAWISVQRVTEMMLGVTRPASAEAHDAQLVAVEPASANAEQSEVFARDVDELAAHLIHRAVADVGVPVELMQKRHKIEVVRDLKSRGMFLLRDAVDMIASSLKVTRFTIYNYLNEIADEEESDVASTGSDTTDTLKEI
jgi:predicted transcriptional regulator YheO